jgi:D-alanine transaminase
LHGITRKAVLACAKVLKMNVEERPFTINEAWRADEAFSTSASGFINPIVQIDGKVIGSGEPGPVGDKLRALYLDESFKAAV